jgi:hypothetical protein
MSTNRPYATWLCGDRLRGIERSRPTDEPTDDLIPPTLNERNETVTVHADLSNRERLLAMASELQTLSYLIEKYPAETQLIMAALEDGLTLGPMQVPAIDDRPGHSAAPSRRRAVADTQS